MYSFNVIALRAWSDIEFYIFGSLNLKLLWWAAGTCSLLLVLDLKEWFEFVHAGLNKLVI